MAESDLSWVLGSLLALVLVLGIVLRRGTARVHAELQQLRLLQVQHPGAESAHRQALLAGLQQELEIARQMQRSILPRNPLHAPGVQVDAVMEPASEVGGDFYDYFLVDENRLALVVADVSGKGIPAAFFMAVSRTLLKSLALLLRDPVRVMTQLNAQLAAENEPMMFVTVFFCVLDLRTGTLDFVNAGHNPPVIRAAGGQVRMLPRNQNMALGVNEHLRLRAGRAVLRPGDTLLLYTDGIVEAGDPLGRMFGEQRLLEAVLRYPGGAQSLPLALLREVRSFEGGRPQADDITCVALRLIPVD